MSSRSPAHALLKLNRAGYGGRRWPVPPEFQHRPEFQLSYAELNEYLAALVTDLREMSVGSEAVRRCFGVKAIPETQDAVATSLGLTRRQVQYHIRRLIARLDGALGADEPCRNGEESGRTPQGDGQRTLTWPGLEELRRRIADQDGWYRRRLIRAMGAARTHADPKSARIARGRRVSLEQALQQLSTDLGLSSVRTADDALTPASSWRLRRMAWQALVAQDPDLAVKPVARLSAAPRGLRQAPSDVRESLEHLIKTPPTDRDELASLLTAAEQIYRFDQRLGVRALDAVEGVLKNEPGWHGVRARVASFRLTVACHSAYPIQEVHTRFERVMRLTNTMRGSPERLGAVLDMCTYLPLHGPRLEEPLRWLELLRAELPLSPEDRRPVFERYLAVRYSTVMTLGAIATGNVRLINAARGRLEQVMEDGELPPSTFLDVVRNSAALDAASGLLHLRAGRMPRARRAVEGAAETLRHTRLLVEQSEAGTSEDKAQLWYTRSNLVTVGYRPSIRHVLNELDYYLWLDADDEVRRLLPIAARRWNEDPSVHVFCEALDKLVERAVGRYEIEAPRLTAPLLAVPGDRHARVRRNELTLLASLSGDAVPDV